MPNQAWDGKARNKGKHLVEREVARLYSLSLSLIETNTMVYHCVLYDANTQILS